MSLGRQEMLATVDRGVASCRRGEWKIGFAQLSAVAESDRWQEDLPGLFYSYFGYGLIRFAGRRREGLSLCKHGVKLDFYRGESYYNLAQAYLLIDNRAAAVKAVDQGLAVEPANSKLRRLKKELGWRRVPVLGFLPRHHPVNAFLGRLRHRLFAKKLP